MVPRATRRTVSYVPSLVIGAVLANRYEVQQFLGAGQFGEVYAVLDRHQGQAVALKLLDPTQTGPWPWHEATRLTALRSDYILPVWNADVVAGVPFVVTDIASGGTLDDVAVQVPLPLPRDAVRYIRHASRGASRAHDDGILHRDLKLENLFLDDHNRVLVGDFGLAHPLDAAGHAPPAGTPATSAPEVLAGGPTTVQSEIYSLGACLYRLVTGFYPYVDRHPADLSAFVNFVAAGPPTPVRDLAPHISLGLGARIDKAMARDSNHRYTSASDLDAALGHLPAPARHWHRIPSEPGHLRCWNSLGGATPVRVCTIAQSGTIRVTIEAARITSGYRILDCCRSDVTRVALPGALRATFQRLGN